MTDASPGPAGFAWQQGVALLTGAFYLVLGITGFFFVRDLGVDVTGQSPDSLLGIDLNGAQNFLHILLGVVGLVMATTRPRSRTYGALLAVVGIGLFAFGAVAAGRPDLNVLDLNWPGNVLHLVTGLLGLAVAAVPLRARSRPASER
jgi:hypothetical protein